MRCKGEDLVAVPPDTGSPLPCVCGGSSPHPGSATAPPVGQPGWCWRAERQDEDEAAQLSQLRAQHPEVAAAIALAQDFVRLVRERQPDHLDPWPARAAESPLVPLQRSAKGLRDDYDAVKAGITLPWSNGPVEGHINRLEMLKRQMFGRAKLDLLQQRFLLAAYGRYDGGYRITWFHHERGVAVPTGVAEHQATWVSPVEEQDGHENCPTVLRMHHQKRLRTIIRAKSQVNQWFGFAC
jgi:Transposase